MSTQNLLNDKLHVNAIVRVGKETVHFVSLTIDQFYGDHHRFSVILDYDIMDKSFMSDPVKQFELINSPVTIEIQHGNDVGSAYVFEGIITNVKNTGKEGKHGYIVLEGASPTILLEQGKRMEVYSSMSLRKIFEEVTSRANLQYLKVANNPGLGSDIDFSMQYDETDWKYLQRMAYLYGENLFFSGSELLFGDYAEWKPVEMMYDKEIISYEFASRLLPNAFINYHYLPEDDSTVEKKSPDDVSSGDLYIQKATERSLELTETKLPRMPLNVPVGDKSQLDEIVNRKTTRTAASTIVLTAEAKSFEASIGRLVKVTLPPGISSKGDLGTYRVVKARHEIDQNHRYKNYFEAVPAALKTMPMPQVHIPIAHSVMATVRDNADPNGHGRVQVDFPFAENYSQLWLRVMTPDAGSSGIVAQNRGMVFIPESGDQVMVGFEMGDPNRPYVMGSLFHGNNSLGGQDDNHIKSIITRSGHTIEFDDADSSLGITIKDKNGNFIYLDTQGKNIEITAPETITLNAKNVNINAEENIMTSSGINTNMQVGNNLIQVADNEHQLIASKAVSTIENENQMYAKKIEGIADKVTLDSTKENMDLNSSKKVNVQSADKINLF